MDSTVNQLSYEFHVACRFAVVVNFGVFFGDSNFKRACLCVERSAVNFVDAVAFSRNDCYREVFSRQVGIFRAELDYHAGRHTGIAGELERLRSRIFYRICHSCSVGNVSNLFGLIGNHVDIVFVFIEVFVRAYRGEINNSRFSFGINDLRNHPLIFFVKVCEVEGRSIFGINENFCIITNGSEQAKRSLLVDSAANFCANRKCIAVVDAANGNRSNQNSIIGFFSVSIYNHVDSSIAAGSDNFAAVSRYALNGFACRVNNDHAVVQRRSIAGCRVNHRNFFRACRDGVVAVTVDNKHARAFKVNLNTARALRLKSCSPEGNKVVIVGSGFVVVTFHEGEGNHARFGFDVACVNNEVTEYVQSGTVRHTNVAFSRDSRHVCYHVVFNADDANFVSSFDSNRNVRQICHVSNRAACIDDRNFTFARIEDSDRIFARRNCRVKHKHLAHCCIADVYKSACICFRCTGYVAFSIYAVNTHVIAVIFNVDNIALDSV